MKKTFILATLLFGALLMSSSPVEARHHRRCHSSFSVGIGGFQPAYYGPAYYCPPPPPPVYACRPPAYAYPTPYYGPVVYQQPVYVERPCYVAPVGFSFGLNFFR